MASNDKKTGDDTSAVREVQQPKPDREKPGKGSDDGSGETSPRTGDRVRGKTIQQVAAIAGGGAVLLGCGLSHRKRLPR